MVKKWVTYITLGSIGTFFCRQAIAQPSLTDSLELKRTEYKLPARLEQKDTVYLGILGSLCNEYKKAGVVDSLLPLSVNGLKLTEEIPINKDDSLAVLRIENFKMDFYRYQGIYYFQTGDYVNSYKQFQQYLNQAEKTGSVMDIGNAYNYFAYNHRELEDYDQALKFAKKAAAILESTVYKSALANSYMVFGTYYLNKGIFPDSAVLFLRHSIQLYQEDGNTAGASTTTFDLAEAFYVMKEIDSSSACLNRVKPFVMESGNPFLMVRYYVMTGRTAYAKGNNKLALMDLRKAKKFADETENAQDDFNVNKYLTLALAADQQFLPSLEAMNATMDAYSQDIDTEKARALNSTKLNFEFEREKQKQQFAFEKKQAVAQMEIQRQKTIKNFSLLGVISGIVIAILLWSLYRQSKKSEKNLTEKNAEVEKSYRELQEMQEQLVATEKQREAQSVRVRIARDIHDELGAGLTKITLLSDVARRRAVTGDGEIAKALERVIENSKGVSASLNEIVWAVNPTNDTLDVMTGYLKKYAAEFLEDAGINYHLSFDDITDTVNVSPELKRNIFLVLKEALNNAVKYSNAKDISVDFHLTGKYFRFKIADNGLGFDPEAIRPSGSGGNGLLNMKSRMEQVQCSLKIISSRFNGCAIEAAGKLT